MTQVWERIFLGSEDDANALTGSNLNGVTTVISLCSQPVRSKAAGINYLRFPIRPFEAVTRAKFDKIIDAIAENVRWGTVLLHCNAGISRSPAMLAAWMDVVGYKNFDKALEEIATVRPAVSPEPVLVDSIRQHLR